MVRLKESCLITILSFKRDLHSSMVRLKVISIFAFKTTKMIYIPIW